MKGVHHTALVITVIGQAKHGSKWHSRQIKHKSYHGMMTAFFKRLNGVAYANKRIKHDKRSDYC
jgi:hypothetical protein